MYHRFGTSGSARQLHPRDLEMQLQHLRRHYAIVPLREVANCVQQGRPLPRLAVALTVDDGYADFAELAYPVFCRLRVPVTLYVTGHFVDGHIWLWWDAIRYLVQHTEAQALDFEFDDRILRLRFDSEQNREVAWSTLADVGVTLDPNRQDLMVTQLQHLTGVSLPTAPTPEFSASNWATLKALDPSVVEIGAHTLTHPILSRCDSARIVDEVSGSKAHIESQLGRGVVSFCYPNGQPEDVDDRCTRAVRDAGYESAVMACGGQLSERSNVLALERMPARHGVRDFMAAVDGVPDLLRGSKSAPRLPSFRY